MKWRRTDPVQNVGASIVRGADAHGRLAAALSRRPAAFGALMVAQGDAWAAVFGAPPAGESEVVLPRVPGATHLYEVERGWWFPVGLVLDVPDRHAAALLQALATPHGIRPPAILLPHSGTDAGRGAVDLFPTDEAVRFAQSPLASAFAAA